MREFVHLHVHSEYSLLDGFGRIKQLVSKAKESGMKALALTDHGVMFGAVDFYRTCKNEGIKPIIGSEVYVADGSMHEMNPEKKRSFHLVLLAKNQTGYKNLMKIVSVGYVDGFYYKPRIDREFLREHSEGLIALSACLAGEIPKAILAGQMDQAEKLALDYQSIFGKENFFLEIQDHRMPEEAKVREGMRKLSEKLGIGLVATNDVHYVEKGDALYHDALICIQTGKKVSDEDRMRYTGDFSLRSPDEMIREFASYPGAIDNTVRIADMVNFEMEEGSNHMPVFEIPEEYGNAGDYLSALCHEGLKKRYGTIDQSLIDRLNHELGVIHDMGFDNYFLVVWDFIKYAKDHGIAVGPGRGSAAGSLVAYTLDITTLDPIRYQLLFERFLNPERYTMPDIDVDFCYERRPEVIEYVTQKYGKDHVAQIVTFGTMLARGAIRDVARVLDVDYNTADKLAKEIPMRPGQTVTIDMAFEENKQLRAMTEADPVIRQVMDYAKKLEGLARHASTHAAGVVISDKPLIEYVPLYRNQDSITTQYTMGLLESQGLIKMDVRIVRQAKASEMSTN